MEFPYSLRFHPTGKITFPDTYHGTFTDDFKTIADGSTLYEIYAMDKPVELGGKEQKIGELNLDGAFTTSKWGDEHYFIRHQFMDEDIKIHPEWEKYTPKFSWRSSFKETIEQSNEMITDVSEGAKIMLDETAKKARAMAAGCPFAYLM